MSNKTTRLAPHAFTFLLSSLPLLAQAQTPPDAGQILNEQQRLQQQRLNRLPSDDVPAERPAMREIGGTRVTVKEIVFSGEERIATREELQKLVAGSLGQALGFDELQALADRVSTYLRGKGYPLVGAYLPTQDVTEGRIEIAIVEGRIQNGANGVVIRADSTLRMSQSRLRSIAERAVEPGQPVRQSDLERAVLLINDLPGIAARGSLERGDEAGTSRLALTVAEARMLTGGTSIDTYGNRYNGSERLNARVGLDDPLRIGDQAGLSLTKSEGLGSASIDYSLPVGSSGLRLGVGYTALEYEVREELRHLDAEGDARTASINASYPIVRSRATNLWGTAIYNYKSLTDEMMGLTLRDKRINSGSLSFAGSHQDRLGGAGITQLSLVYTSGDLDLSRVAFDKEADALTARTDGGFSKIGYGLARLQRLSDRVSMFGAINGQLTGDNLDSSERFILGGPTGVRAYPVGEGSGDSGWVGTVEVRYDVPFSSNWGELQLVGFADHGETRLYEKPWIGAVYNMDGRNSYGLSGAGVGFNLTAQGRYSVRFSYAAAIDDNPGRSVTGKNADGRDQHGQFWLQGSVQL
ncbi:ShlB/FhaC/HecB family hemolysin secretion/activation protein [Peristeroidobacter agariperforans]|uniref:ShlB/FhaC/HecB family hemolysin secretion/activation protein n=1 Tax=Peristeroidobacter agariperforans TaxID=268404 RepID=UPI00101DB5A5|nr:ShlB/FhaC/HecB family hemolysin secretion/activation protein [Peristeroidobacter agariperforans]